MRIVLYGANGMLGQRIFKEALDRKHQVTAVTRDPSHVTAPPGAEVRQGDVLDVGSIMEIAKGQDAIISAVGPPHGGDHSIVVAAARSLIAAAPRASVRLITVGGAATLEVAPGVQLIDTPYLPPEWKESALAHREALE